MLLALACVRAMLDASSEDCVLRFAPPFDDCLETPEIAWDELVPATDTFMIAATVYYLARGQAPFAGRDWVCQSDAMGEEGPRPYGGDPALGGVIERALRFRAEERPPLAELAAALARAGEAPSPPGRR